MSWTSQHTDEALMIATQEGDEHALTELYERYSPALFQFFYKMLNKDEEKANDFLHDLFVKIITKQHHYKADHLFSSWVYSIAHNMVKNEYRRMDVRSIMTELPKDLTRSEQPICIEQLDAAIFQKHLNRVLESLSPEKRHLFVFRHQLEMSINELSQVFEVPVGTVKSRLHHLHQLIAKKLNSYKP